jgi:hypothetical protein
MTVISRERSGMASGVSGTVRFSGLVIGIAALGAVLRPRGGGRGRHPAAGPRPRPASARARHHCRTSFTPATRRALPIKPLVAKASVVKKRLSVQFYPFGVVTPLSLRSFCQTERAQKEGENPN